MARKKPITVVESAAAAFAEIVAEGLSKLTPAVNDIRRQIDALISASARWPSETFSKPNRAKRAKRRAAKRPAVARRAKAKRRAN